MNDILIELQEKNDLPLQAPKEAASTASSQDKFNEEFPQMQTLMDKIKGLQRSVSTIHENNNELLQLKKKFKDATNSDVEKKYSKELDHLVSENNNMAAGIKKEMESISKSIDQFKNDPKLKDEPEIRMLETMLRGIGNKTGELLTNSQLIQTEFKQSIKNKMSRQVMIIDPNINSEEANQLVAKEPEAVANMLKDKLTSGSSHKLQNAFSDIHEKCEEIKKLEKTVHDTFELMKELAIMVKYQGEVIDSVEANVSCAKDYVHKGVVSLGNAKEEHQKSKKLMCIIAAVLIIIVLVIVLVIFVIAGQKRKIKKS